MPDHSIGITCSVHCAMWLFVSMSWNGNQKDGVVGSTPAAARSGKNAAIHTCGRVPGASRLPNCRIDENVIQNIRSPLTVCSNGAHRVHELSRPVWMFARSSLIAAPPVAGATHSSASGSLYESPVDRSNTTHAPSGDTDG